MKEIRCYGIYDWQGTGNCPFAIQSDFRGWHEVRGLEGSARLSLSS